MNDFFELRKKFQSNIINHKFDCLDDNIRFFQTTLTLGLDEKNRDFFSKSLLQDVYEIEISPIKTRIFLQISEIFRCKGEALIHAMEYKQDDIIEHYVKIHNLNLKDQYNISPLIFAINKKNLKLAQNFLDAGADVNILGDYNNNAMNYATDQDYLEMAKLLTSRGIDLNHFNLTGDNCLMRAIRGRSKDMISFFFNYPETLFLYKENTENPLQLALRELTFSSLPDSSIASMVCIQYAINFPEHIPNFKKYDGYTLIKNEVDSILDNIALENTLQHTLDSAKPVKGMKI